MNEGKIVAYVGPMGSGKTAKLIDLYNELLADGVKAKIFKHFITREGEEGEFIYSRNGNKAPAIVVQSIYDVIDIINIENLEAVLIDEIQFFDDEDIAETLDELAADGIEIYVFGLDVTSENKTFGQIGDILAHADEVYKLNAPCVGCGDVARISKYIKDDKEDDIKPGDLDDYKPFCRYCYYNFDKNSDHSDGLIDISIMGKNYYFECSIQEDLMNKLGFRMEDLKKLHKMEDVLKIIELLIKIERGDADV